jgi:hypothetical protein
MKQNTVDKKGGNDMEQTGQSFPKLSVSNYILINFTLISLYAHVCDPAKENMY